MGQEVEATVPADAKPLVDPMELTLAGPPGLAMASSSSSAAPVGIGGPLVAAPVEPALLSGVVRRVVWGGDRRRGVARIELDGAFAGTSIWLSGEGRALEVEVVAGPGFEGDRLAERLLARLGARGIAVRSCDVR